MDPHPNSGGSHAGDDDYICYSTGLRLNRNLSPAHVSGVRTSSFMNIGCGRYIKRSHRISVVQNAHVDQNTICAVLRRSVAFFNCLFPLPTFSVVSCESATSWSMCSAWMLRLAASVVCSSEISRSDFSAVLARLAYDKPKWMQTHRT